MSVNDDCDAVLRRLERLEGLCVEDEVVGCVEPVRVGFPLLERSGFPRQYCGVELPCNGVGDGVARKRADKLGFRFLGGAGRGCLWLVVGARGTGKSLAAARLAREGGFDKAWCFVGDGLYRERLAKQELGFGVEREWCRGLRGRRGSLLVLDECQRGVDVSDGRKVLANEFFEEVVNGRYDAELDSVVIGNWSKEDVGRAVPASVLDRVRQRQLEGRGGLVVCDWGSLRVRGV